MHVFTRTPFILVFCFVLSFFSCKPDEPDDPEPIVYTFPGTWEVFSTDNGLSSNAVRAIIQDNAGTMWFSTWDKGITKFDGAEWEYIEDAYGGGWDPKIINFFRDSKENILIASNNGLIWYDGVKGEKNSSLWWQFYDVLETSDQRVFACTFGGTLVEFGADRQSYTINRAPDSLDVDGLYNIIENREGEIMAASGNGIIVFDGENWDVIRMVYDYSPDLTGGEYIPNIIEDRNGNLWAMTWGGGVLKYDGQRWTTYTGEDGLIGMKGWAIMEDSKGNIWAGMQNGLCRFDGESWASVGSERIQSPIYYLFEDADGAIWIGTRSHGALKYTP